MSFIKKVVGPDEKLIGITSIHWMYGVQGFMWLIGFLAFGVFLDSGISRLFAGFSGNPGMAAINTIADYSLWICMALGVIIFLTYFLTMISAEIGLTTKRVIYKRGLIFVDVRQVDIEEIKSADVNNGFLGRFFNYGYIALDARFVANISLPAVDDPYRFTKALNEMRTQTKDTMKIVLEGMPDNVEAHVKGEGESAPRRSLMQKRYDALDDNPARAVGEVVEEAVQTTARSSEGVPIKRRRTRGAKLATERRHRAKLRQAQPASQPIIFKQVMLRRDIKENFTDSSHLQ